MTNVFSRLVPNALYRAEYHAAELYHGTSGKRVFSLNVNGTNFFTGLDLVRDAGGKGYAYAVKKEVQADASGRIRYFFTKTTDHAMYGGLAIFGTNAPSFSRFRVEQVPGCERVKLTYAATDALAYYVQVSDYPAGPWVTTGVVQNAFSYEIPAEKDRACFYRVVASNGVGVTSSPVRSFLPKFSVYALNTSYVLNRYGRFCPDDWSVSGMQGRAAELGSAENVDSLSYPVPSEIFLTAKYGPKLMYRFPHLRAEKKYTLRMYLSEGFFSAAGNRVFDVYMNGVLARAGIDIYQLSGGNRYACSVEIPGIVPDENQCILFEARSTVDYAQIAALELVEEESEWIPLKPLLRAYTYPGGGVQVVAGSQTADLRYEIRRKKDASSEWVTVVTDALNGWIDLEGTAQSVYAFRAVTPQGVCSEWSDSISAASLASVPQDYVGFAAVDEPVQGTHGWFVPYTNYLMWGGSYWDKKITTTFPTEHLLDPAPDVVYQTMFYSGSFQFLITNLYPYAQYRVRFHGVEPYFSSVENRVYLLQINQQTVLSEFDPYAWYGKNTLFIREFLTPATAEGIITIRGMAGKDQIQVSAIEAVLVSGTVTAGASVAHRLDIKTDAEREWRTGVSPALALQAEDKTSEAAAASNRVVWDGVLTVPMEGAYTFELRQNGVAALFIDEDLVLNTSSTSAVKTVSLSAGGHHIRYRYERENLSLLPSAGVYWSSPYFEKQLVAAPYLSCSAESGVSTRDFAVAGHGWLGRSGDFYPVKSSSGSSPVWRMYSSGNDIWKGNDSAYYAYDQMEGEFDAVVRVLDLKDQAKNTKFGLAVRTSLGGGKGDYLWISTANYTVSTGRSNFYYCLTGDDYTDGMNNSEYGWGYNLTLPFWLKISRRYKSTGGMEIVSSYSQDGTTWLGTETKDVSAAKKVYVGFALCGHREDRLPQVTLDHFEIAQRPPRATLLLLQ